MLCFDIVLDQKKPDVVLSTYILDSANNGNPVPPRPAVLVLPGGGYAFTSDHEAQAVALAFANAGFHAFVLRYPVGAAARMPAPVLAGFSALAHIRAHADAWNLNAKQVAVCGFSAGGHLAACLATMWADRQLTAPLGCQPEQLRPNAVLLCYALLQLPYAAPPQNTGLPAETRQQLIDSLLATHRAPQHPGWSSAILEQDGTLWIDSAKLAYLNAFGSPAPAETELARYSPVLQVGPDTPPAFLWTTTPDELVPVGDTVNFATAMLRHNRPAELHVFGSGAHGLSLAKPVTGSTGDAPAAAPWLDLALRWLADTLPAPDTAPVSPFEQSGMGGTASAVDAAEKPAQYYENIFNDRAGMFRHTPFALEQQLVRYVIQGDETAALDTLGKIDRQGDKAVLAADPLRSAKNSIICSCTFLARAVIQGGVPAEEAFALSDAAIQHIETLSRQQDVLQYEAALMVQFIRLVKTHHDKSYSTPVRRALHYIDAHLDKPLRLQDVADYAKVHPNYLSKRFRQETGTTLSSYAVGRKIHESVYFVQHTNYSMAEIASLYGFSSQSYFITQFKKVLGMPPGEYRNNIDKIQ